MDSAHQLAMLRSKMDIIPFELKLAETGLKPFRATAINILQMNITRKCNMACRHCHVQAGPHRTEMMSRTILEKCLVIARNRNISTIDITGGAPEMHPQLEWFLSEASKLGKRMIVRSNLVILLDEKYRKLIDIFAKNKVEVVGSLPDYRHERTDRQRGEGIFYQVIDALRALNGTGYGIDGTGLILDLVHNPSGAYLPGPQKALEHEYHEKLTSGYGVHFSKLFCLTNCPVGRYLEFLDRSDNLVDYMRDLYTAYNASAAQNVMCRTTLSVGWDGTLYDCDFNQMLDVSVNHGAPDHIDTFDYDSLATREIVVANHCYCCTAGAGSSCQGAIHI